MRQRQEVQELSWRSEIDKQIDLGDQVYFEMKRI